MLEFIRTILAEKRSLLLEASSTIVQSYIWVEQDPHRISKGKQQWKRENFLDAILLHEYENSSDGQAPSKWMRNLCKQFGPLIHQCQESPSSCSKRIIIDQSSLFENRIYIYIYVRVYVCTGAMLIAAMILANCVWVKKFRSVKIMRNGFGQEHVERNDFEVNAISLLFSWILESEDMEDFWIVSVNFKSTSAKLEVPYNFALHLKKLKCKDIDGINVWQNIYKLLIFLILLVWN